MKDVPDISRVASLIGDPARANMLSALMTGRALTATELACEAGVTKQTASAHLSRLVGGGLLKQVAQGRNRYFSIADADVAAAIEALDAVAAKGAGRRVRPGPKDTALRRARVCYDHLAGELGVDLFERLEARGLIAVSEGGAALTAKGERKFSTLGVDIAALKRGRRPVCRPCLDWSERKFHLGGALGKSLLDEILARKWAARSRNDRTARFTAWGEQALRDWIG